jgi:hypothetical protein
MQRNNTFLRNCVFMKLLEISLSCFHFSLMFSEGEVKSPWFFWQVWWTLKELFVLSKYLVFFVSGYNTFVYVLLLWRFCYIACLFFFKLLVHMYVLHFDISQIIKKATRIHKGIGDVMISVLASSVVDCGFEPPLGRNKDNKIGICCFSTKHAALRRKSKNWLAQNQDNVSEWADMSIHRLLFQWASTMNNPTELVGLVQSWPHHHLIEK